MPASYFYSLQRNIKLFALSFKSDALSFMEQKPRGCKNIYFPSCWVLDFIFKSYNILSFQSCRLSVLWTFCGPKKAREGWLSVLPFIFPNMSLFNSIFLLISSIWFSYDPEHCTRCVYIVFCLFHLYRDAFLHSICLTWFLFASISVLILLLAFRIELLCQLTVF